MWAKCFVKLFTSSGSSFFFCKEQPDDVNNFCKEEPDDVNNLTKKFAHILNFEFYCPYCITYDSINGVMFFDLYFPAFYRYTVSGYTSYNSGMWKECSMRVFITVTLRN